MSSDFIKVLLILPTVQSISDTPTHLNQNADIVRHYIDFITLSNAHDITLDTAGFQDLLDLCNHLKSPAIETCVLGAIKTRMDRRPIRKTLTHGALSLLPRDVTLWLWPSARSDSLVISIFGTDSSRKRLRSRTTSRQGTSMLHFDPQSTPTLRIRPGNRVPVTVFVSCL